MYEVQVMQNGEWVAHGLPTKGFNAAVLLRMAAERAGLTAKIIWLGAAPVRGVPTAAVVRL